MQSSQLRAHGLAARGRDLVLLFASLALVAERDDPAALGQRRERAVERARGEPQIVFLESENSTTDIMNGDFRWDIAVTPTPPLKSASVYVAYTDAGFSVYYEGGDE